MCILCDILVRVSETGVLIFTFAFFLVCRSVGGTKTSYFPFSNEALCRTHSSEMPTIEQHRLK